MPHMPGDAKPLCECGSTSPLHVLSRRDTKTAAMHEIQQKGDATKY